MTRLVDDIDGSQAVTTLSFALDGLSYEIDLSESHLDAFQQAMAPFVRVARKVPGGHRTRDTAAAPTKEPVPKEPATKEPAPKEPAPKKPAAKRAPRPNGHPVPADDVVTEVAAARPTVVNSPPFQQPKPNLNRGSAGAPTGSKPTRAPLVADPFNPGAHR
jgi:ABC-type Fe3+-hydroxamate transport system substrate-binding protein